MNLLNVYCHENSNNSEAIFQPKPLIAQPIYTPSETGDECAENSLNSEIDRDFEGDRTDKNERHSDWIQLSDFPRDSYRAIALRTPKIASLAVSVSAAMPDRAIAMRDSAFAYS